MKFDLLLLQRIIDSLSKQSLRPRAENPFSIINKFAEDYLAQSQGEYASSSLNAAEYEKIMEALLILTHHLNANYKLLDAVQIATNGLIKMQEIQGDISSYVASDKVFQPLLKISVCEASSLDLAIAFFGWTTMEIQINCGSKHPSLQVADFFPRTKAILEKSSSHSCKFTEKTRTSWQPKQALSA